MSSFSCISSILVEEKRDKWGIKANILSNANNYRRIAKIRYCCQFPTEIQFWMKNFEIAIS